MVSSGLDLNLASSIRGIANPIARTANEHGQTCFCASDSHLPLTTFRRCVARYNGEHKVKHFTCLDQFLCMAFAQLDLSRESLRD